MTEENRIMSEFAVASLVMGIMSFFNLFGLDKAIVAIVFGSIALARIGKNNFLKGKKIAISGIVLGVLSLILTVFLTVKYLPKIIEMQQQMIQQQQQSQPAPAPQEPQTQPAK